LNLTGPYRVVYRLTFLLLLFVSFASFFNVSPLLYIRSCRRLSSIVTRFSLPRSTHPEIGNPSRLLACTCSDDTQHLPSCSLRLHTCNAHLLGETKSFSDLFMSRLFPVSTPGFLPLSIHASPHIAAHTHTQQQQQQPSSHGQLRSLMLIGGGSK